MRAISALSFDAGTSTRGSLARTPFRIRVIMSATGSVMFMSFTSKALLPARLDDARDLARERQLTEADAAHLELAEVAAGPPAPAAAGVLADRELRLPLGLGNEGQLGHLESPPTGTGTACPGTAGGASTPRRSWPWSG